MMADANRAKINGDSAQVRSIVDSAPLIYGVWQDVAEPDSIGLLILKGIGSPERYHRWMSASARQQDRGGGDPFPVVKLSTRHTNATWLLNEFDPRRA